MSTQNTLIRPMTNWATAAASRTEYDMLVTIMGQEVLTAYDPTLTLVNRLTRASIESGTTKRFPKTWKIGSEVHEAGAEMLGMEFETGYEEISLDPRPLVTHGAYDDVDIMLAQYDVRGPVSQKMGVELAKQADKRAWTLLVNAAITADDTDDSFPGRLDKDTIGVTGLTGIDDGVYTNNALDVVRYSGPSAANCAANAEALMEGLDQIGLAFDYYDVPKEGRQVCVDPYIFLACRKYGLPGVPTTVSSTLSYGGTPNLNAFGAGPITGGYPYNAELDYNGWRIFQSANSPWNTNISTGPSKWQVNASNVFAVAFHPDSCAWVEKTGVVMEAARIPQKLQTFISARVMHGGGTLRPYCACALKGNGS